MNLTYGDLISRDTCVKLSMVSFGTPQKNLEVYKFVSALRPIQEFFEVERSKLFSKYGTEEQDGKYTIRGEDNIKSYQMDLKKITDMKIEDKLPKLNLTEADFSLENCTYSPDKDIWMNANDIEAVLNISKKLNS